MGQFSQLRDAHKGEKMLVVGCGSSASELSGRDIDVASIGVNDIGLIFDPTYLMVVDAPRKFPGKRYDLVHNTKAKYLLTQLPAWKVKKPAEIMLFKLGSKVLKYLDKQKHPNQIDYSNNSPFMACVAAYKMGAKHIGMIGVDFTPNHFYAKDGDHSLVQKNLVRRSIDDFSKLKKALNDRGVRIYNLSRKSIVNTLPKLTLDQFLKIE